jgi:hypothetical protein
MKYQVTLFCNNGKYKPVASIVDVAKITTKEQKLAAIRKGTEKICIKRLWTSAELKKYGYTKAKIRQAEG